ncbi:MAG: hypothetical protein ACRD3V_14670, partial [Vicinamibacteria bacterium]
MKGSMLLAALLAVSAPREASTQTVVVFVDGTRMDVQSYEVKDGLVLLKTKEGKLLSVPRSYVNLVATEDLVRSGGESAAPPPAPPTPATARTPIPPARPRPIRDLPSESVEPEPPVTPLSPPPPDPTPPPPPPAAPAPPVNLASPPPVWSNEELQVSLVVPSGLWMLEDMPPSFDVAVALANPSTEARATLALIRKKLRSGKDFRNVVAEVEGSISQSPGYRSILNGVAALEPYTAHEFRFVKTVGAVR